MWHERDISLSSVERIILPDASILTHYMLVRTKQLIEGLVVFPERMLANFDLSHGLVFSQPVLLALVAAGSTRDDAYRMVQRDAMQAWETAKSFRSVLEADPEVTALLTQAQLDAAFDLARALRYAGRAIDAMEEIE